MRIRECSCARHIQNQTLLWRQAENFVAELLTIHASTNLIQSHQIFSCFVYAQSAIGYTLRQSLHNSFQLLASQVASARITWQRIHDADYCVVFECRNSASLGCIQNRQILGLIWIECCIPAWVVDRIVCTKGAARGSSICLPHLCTHLLSFTWLQSLELVVWQLLPGISSLTNSNGASLHHLAKTAVCLCHDLLVANGLNSLKAIIDVIAKLQRAGNTLKHLSRFDIKILEIRYGRIAENGCGCLFALHVFSFCLSFHFPLLELLLANLKHLLALESYALLLECKLLCIHLSTDDILLCLISNALCLQCLNSTLTNSADIIYLQLGQLHLCL